MADVDNNVESAGQGGKPYWDGQWDQNRTRELIRLFPFRRIEVLLEQHFLPPGPWSVLELGCGGSVWLPYFAERGATEVAGIDYSPEGIRLAQLQCSVAGVDPTLVKADLRTRVDPFTGRFDRVFSYGTIEHFHDPEVVLRHACAYLKPSGVIFSLIPNIRLLIGLLSKWIHRQAYEQHYWIDLDRLKRVHEELSFETLFCGYRGTFDFDIINRSNLRGFRNWLFTAVVSKTNGLCWRTCNALRRYPETALFSPYLVYIGRNRGTAGADGTSRALGPPAGHPDGSGPKAR